MAVLDFMHWTFAIFIFLLQAMILWLIWLGADNNPTRGINLSKLISEKDGSASLSRFQALLFTFIVVAVFAYRAFSETKGWPKIDENTLYLLGGSGATYLGSKAIQKNAEGRESGRTSPSGTETDNDRFAR